MKFPFNRTETVLFVVLFPIWFILHWNGILGFFYEGIATKIGSATGFFPALVSAIFLYLAVLTIYYLLRKTFQSVFTNKWFLGVLGLLVVGFIGLAVYLNYTNFFSIDVCLDRGGSWNYSLKKCDTNEAAVSRLSVETKNLNALKDMPPLDQQELQHQAWVYYVNKITEDYSDAEICWGQGAFYDPEIAGTYTEKIKVKDGYLMKIWCDTGAYNTTFAMVYMMGETGRLVEFPELDENDLPNNSSPYATNLYYDPASKIFSMFHKGRGLGDCGVSAEYLWDDETKKMVMKEFRMKDECDGKNDDWPTVYQLSTTNEPTPSEVNLDTESEVPEVNTSAIPQIENLNKEEPLPSS